MTVCLRDQGYGFHAERRGQGRTTGLEGLPPLRADRETTSRHSSPPPASRYAGGMPVAGDLPVVAGETFAHAFAGVCAGKECWRRLPSLTIAINWCENGVGRIVPVASAEI